MEPHLVALDVDGTIVTHAGELGERTRDAIRAVSDAGHEVVISTGRSIVATLPVLRALDLSHGFAVCSNGAVTVRLDPTAPDGYLVEETVTFDPRQALTLVMEHAPHILVAVEEVGVGECGQPLEPDLQHHLARAGGPPKAFLCGFKAVQETANAEHDV